MTTPHKAMLAATPAHYERLGLTRQVQPFEDGLRTDPHHKGGFEWWYFDAHLSNGAKLVVGFHTKNPTAPNTGLAPTVMVDLDLPDGRTIHRRAQLSGEQFAAAKDHCDVRIGECRFTGDLHEYRIHAVIEDLRVDVALIRNEAGTLPTYEVTEAQEEVLRELLGRFSGKWPLWTLHILGGQDAPLRFARLLERVDGISQKMLTQTVRNLERDGLVQRTVYAEVPPRVEYELTAIGREILVRFKPFWLWIASHLADFEAARARFDSAAQRP